MEEICRLCCSSSFVQHEIFEPQGELHQLMGPFLFAPLQVRRNDGLPQRVCKACRDYVLQLHLFCSQARSVQCRLHSLLEGLEPLVKCEPACEQATQADHKQSPYTEMILRSDCATQTEHQEPSPALPCRCSASLQKVDAVPLEDIKSNEPCPSPLFVEIQHPPESPEPIQIDQCDVLEKDLCKERNPGSEVRRVPLQVLQTESNDQDCKSNGCIDQDASLQKVDAVPLEDIKTNEPCPSPLFVEIQHPPESPEPIQINQFDVLEEDLCKEKYQDPEIKRVPLQVLQTLSNEQNCNSNDANDEKDLECSKQTDFHVSESEDLMNMYDKMTTDTITISDSDTGKTVDSDEHTPLIQFKKRKKLSSKKPSTAKSKTKDKPKKKKSKKNTMEHEKQNSEAESDSLEEIEEIVPKKKKRSIKKSKTEDIYANWCCICDKKMRSPDACLQHYEEHRSSGSLEQEMPIRNINGRCPLCHALTTAEDWPEHWQKHQKHPYCRLCKASHTNFDKLIEHGLKYHVQRSDKSKRAGKYLCEFCNHSFASLLAYRKHRDRMHESDSRPRPRCGSCAYASRSISSFQVHMQRKHERTQLLCPHCGKSFNDSEHLKRHLILHTGEKPFKCQYCSRGFSAGATLRDHERTHTGEKPHVCPECSRGFAQRSALVTHMRGLHGYARKHVCQLCAKAFTARSLLTAHQRRPCLRPDDDDDDDDDDEVTAPAPAPPRKPRTRRAKRQDDSDDSDDSDWP